LSYISILPFLAITILAALMLGYVWISKDNMTESPGKMTETPDVTMQAQTQSVQRDGKPDVLTGSYFRAMLRRIVATEQYPGPLEVQLDQSVS
jgi:hypothetical protein